MSSTKPGQEAVEYKTLSELDNAEKFRNREGYNNNNSHIEKLKKSYRTFSNNSYRSIAFKGC